MTYIKPTLYLQGKCMWEKIGEGLQKWISRQNKETVFMSAIQKTMLHFKFAQCNAHVTSLYSIPETWEA